MDRHRRRDRPAQDAAGQVAGPEERITSTQALDLAQPEDPGGLPRLVRPGMAADLVIPRAPLAQVPALPEPVRAVLLGGALQRAADG